MLIEAGTNIISLANKLTELIFINRMADSTLS